MRLRRSIQTIIGMIRGIIEFLFHDCAKHIYRTMKYLILGFESILCLIVIFSLVTGASTRQPYSYYETLRWVVSISSLILMLVSIAKRNFGILAFFILTAFLFNPVHKVYLKKNTWHLIDYTIAIVFTLLFLYNIYESKFWSKLKAER